MPDIQRRELRPSPSLPAKISRAATPKLPETTEMPEGVQPPPLPKVNCHTQDSNPSPLESNHQTPHTGHVPGRPTIVPRRFRGM